MWLGLKSNQFTSFMDEENIQNNKMEVIFKYIIF